MKLSYEFNNGETAEIEVSEEIGNMIMESRREECNQDRKQRAHCYSLDDIDFEGLDFADPETPASIMEKEDDENEFYKTMRTALETLTPTQKRRFLLYVRGLSLREIARREYVSDHKKISKSIEAARKKLKKFF